MTAFQGTPRPDAITDAEWHERLRSYEHWDKCLAGYSEQLDPVGWQAFTREQTAGARLAYWRSDAGGFACNGGDSSGDGAVYAGMVQTVKGPLKTCTRQALHATLRPPRWNGKRLWLVSLRGEVGGDAEKFGALERLIIGEIHE